MIWVRCGPVFCCGPENIESGMAGTDAKVGAGVAGGLLDGCLLRLEGWSSRVSWSLPPTA